MKYYLKENFRWIKADGQLYNEAGDEVYCYENRGLFLPRIDLYKYDVNIGHVQTRFSWIRAIYDLVYGSEIVGTLNSKLQFIRSSLEIERLGWRVEGDIFSYNFDIINENGIIVAHMNQEVFHMTQHFSIEIFDEDNEELIVLLVLAINQYDKQRKAAAAAATVH